MRSPTKNMPYEPLSSRVERNGLSPQTNTKLPQTVPPQITMSLVAMESPNQNRAKLANIQGVNVVLPHPSALS